MAAVAGASRMLARVLMATIFDVIADGKCQPSLQNVPRESVSVQLPVGSVIRAAGEARQSINPGFQASTHCHRFRPDHH